MTSRIRLHVALLTSFTVYGSGSLVTAADNPVPTVAQMMAFAPTQKDVEYESPAAADLSKCKVEKVKSLGWVLMGPQGQVLRKFLDSDRDGKYDQFRFYNHGVEVYRDIDSDGNGKPDQCRWLNRGGSRWGIDRDEDKRIDQWKVISAAEASREAIRAMAASDWTALQAVMVTAEDLKSVGLNESLATRLLESVSDAKKKAEGIMKNSKDFKANSVWTRFDAQFPSIIPSEDEKAKEDLQIYESSYAIIESPAKKGADKTVTAVQIGEMIRIGDTWKLTQVPMPIEGKELTTTPLLMEASIASTGAEPSSPSPSPKVEKLFKDLGEVEQRAMQPNQTAAQVKGLMARRASLMNEALELTTSDDERTPLIRQNVDFLALVAHMGTYPEGIVELKAIETDFAKKSPKSPLVPYTKYRRIQAEYYVESMALEGNPKKKQIQTELMKNWLESLEDFIKTYPNSDDSDDAMLVLGTNAELQGNIKDALTWYQKLAKELPKADKAAFAQGAIRRMDLKGKPLALSGPSLSGGAVDVQKIKGQMVLVVFWNSQFPACEEDIPSLRLLYKEYKSRGLEIVGVALDGNEKDVIQAYVKKNNITWPQIFQPGGATGPLAVQYGIINYPTMFLVKKDGTVVSQNASLTEIKAELSDVLASKK